MALALLADAPERFCGAVVEATSYWSPTLKKWKRPCSGHNVRVYFLLHQFDRLRSEGEMAFHEFEEAGIDSKLKIFPGADHELSLDQGVRLIQAAHFVLGNDSKVP